MKNGDTDQPSAYRGGVEGGPVTTWAAVRRRGQQKRKNRGDNGKNEGENGKHGGDQGASGISRLFFLGGGAKLQSAPGVDKPRYAAG